MPEIQLTNGDGTNTFVVQSPEFFACEVCNGLHRNLTDAENCCVEDVEEDAEPETFPCSECGYAWETQEQAWNCCEDEDEDEDRYHGDDGYPSMAIERNPNYVFEIPVITGRPGRICSVEQELSYGGAKVARMLNDMGYAESASMYGYSAEPEAGMMCVKEDGSLGDYGGEVIYSRFKMWDHDQRRRMANALASIRNLRQDGLVKTGTDAGTHIHISATAEDGPTFGPAQMTALWEIFCFCEDLLYRLGSAGWNSHRGTGYCDPLPKYGKRDHEEKISPKKLWDHAKSHRYFAINYGRLISAAGACRCGAAAVGDWDHCTCGAFNDGTIEWRVFNATTKPETMHAWLILAHALTAKAFDYELGSLEPNGYEYSNREEADGYVLGWILNECPVTTDEKYVLLDLAQRSPGVKIDWSEFDVAKLTDRYGEDNA